MKNLNKILENGIPIITINLGLMLMGLGLYNLAKGKMENANLEIGFGAMLGTFGYGFFFGKEYGKKINQKNYQTKPEDYK